MAIVLGIAGVYVVLCVVLWTFQERITFPAPGSPLPDPGKTIGHGERVELTMHDGTRPLGWYLPPLRRPTPPFAGRLRFSGDGETVAAIWPMLRDFRPPHGALLGVDCPG